MPGAGEYFNENLARVAGLHLVGQTQLAHLSGFSRQGVHNMFTNSQPTANTVRVITDLFGIKMDDLFAEPKDCVMAAARAFEDAPIRKIMSEKNN